MPMPPIRVSVLLLRLSGHVPDLREHALPSLPLPFPVAPFVQFPQPGPHPRRRCSPPQVFSTSHEALSHRHPALLPYNPVAFALAPRGSPTLLMPVCASCMARGLATGPAFSFHE